MGRICVSSFLLLAMTSCRLPPDRTPLKPLPEEGQAFAYDEILSRARAQASAGLEAFYIDNWTELADAGRGLEQSARLLPKTIEPPAKLKGKLAQECGEMHKESLRLIDAANARDVNAANETLQRINLLIRRLRPDPPKAPELPKDKKP